MYSVSVEVEISTAHRLFNYDGACNMLHGHNYYITAVLHSKELDTFSDMVMDMKQLKRSLHNVVDRWDHATLLNIRDPLCGILRQAGMSVYTVCGDPTAENMASYIVAGLRAMHPFAGLFNVRVRETEKSEASMQEEEEEDT